MFAAVVAVLPPCLVMRGSGRTRPGSIQWCRCPMWEPLLSLSTSGATPGCLDSVAVEAAITHGTRAIIGGDLYGSMCNWARLREIANLHGLGLIADAAEALESTYAGQRADTEFPAAKGAEFPWDGHSGARRRMRT
ncbi:MAG: DegT/DnrJ/EryC1/StrS family aminotransferase [Paracoccaceae bacterium]